MTRQLAASIALCLAGNTGAAAARMPQDARSRPVMPSFRVYPPPFITVRDARPACLAGAVFGQGDLVFVGAYDGQSLSSVAVGGQDRETNVIDLVIEQGQRPLILALASHESMIWQVTGAVSRVRTAIVSARGDAADRASPAGVVGLSRSKVQILASNCLPAGHKTGPQRNRALQLIEQAAGRWVMHVAGEYSPGSISLPSGVIARAVRPSVVPQGFDAAMWRETLRYWPGGIRSLQPSRVVADVPVERHAILPSQAGLAQLLGSGAMVRDESGAYRIVRPITRFPGGMGGAHSVRLILSRGVPMPAGDPVHSCVIDENTPDLVARSTCVDVGPPLIRHRALKDAAAKPHTFRRMRISLPGLK